MPTMQQGFFAQKFFLGDPDTTSEVQTRESIQSAPAFSIGILNAERKENNQ